MATIDEDLNQIEKDIRTLKIEYEQYFGGGRKRPPVDTQWRVESMIRRHGERTGDLNLAQRFRYNNLASTYAKYQDMWRKKIMNKESGLGRHHYGAAAKAIAEERARAQARARASVDALRAGKPQAAEPASDEAPGIEVSAPAAEAAKQAHNFAMQISNPSREINKVHELYANLVETRITAGQRDGTPSLQDFEKFVQKKTEELKQKGGREVEYTVSVEAGKVKLKARVSR
jgi:hypothetical protein